MATRFSGFREVGLLAMKQASRTRDFQVLANLAGSKLNDFAVARDGGNLLGRAVDVDGVITALAQKLAPVLFRVADFKSTRFMSAPEFRG